MHLTDEVCILIPMPANSKMEQAVRASKSMLEAGGFTACEVPLEDLEDADLLHGADSIPADELAHQPASSQPDAGACAASKCREAQRRQAGKRERKRARGRARAGGRRPAARPATSS